MRSTRSSILLTLGACIALTLFLSDIWFAVRDSRYSTLIEKYECGYEQKLCEVDFNGDGKPELIRIHYRSDAPAELLPEVIDGGQGIYHLNAFSLDNTLRTHVAVRGEGGNGRLLIWEGVQTGRTPRPPVSVVYQWGDGKLSEVEPTAIDNEILAAMAARDDAGTFNGWVAYWMLRWPLRVMYGLLVVIVGVFYQRYRRADIKLP